MGTLWQDIRYALRTLARAPGFTAVALATLALGIGANTAIFSVFYAVVLKPPPFREPSRLIAAWDTYQPQSSKLGVSPAEIGAWSEQADIFEQTGWYRYISKDLTLHAAGAEATEIHATFISPGLLATLGVAPSMGGAGEMLISDALWRTRFAGDRSVIGRGVRLDDQAFTIAGVMPPGFRFPDWADVWLEPGPLLGDEATNPVRHALGFVGRLPRGVSQAQAAARLEDLSKRLAAEHPKTSTGWGIRVSGLQSDLTAGVRPSLMLLAGAVAVVLLIACANVANLLLARASGREREIAIRAALGAGAWRIARQMLTESVVLAGAGGALGVAVGWWSLAEFSPVPAHLDVTALAFAAALTFATGMVFGLAPALHALRGDTNAAMKSGSAGRVTGMLVAAEVALALILVSSAGILMKSFVRLMHVDPGFDPRGVLTMRVTVPPSRNGVDLFHRIEQRVSTFPGVDAVAGANAVPLIANRANTSRFNVPGSPLINPNALPAAQLRAVSPDYFRAMNIPLLAGRGFTERDLNQPVAIINETMARRYWPGKNPVGEKYVSGVWGPAPVYSTIVGVAGDVKQFGLDSEPSDDEYFPYAGPAYVIVHTRGDAASLGAAVRGAIHDIDADLPVEDVRTMEQIEAESARSRRWTLALLAAFAGVAWGLALVGIYGVMAWSVERRTREIGIRVALGAEPGRVARLVLTEGVKLCAMGSGIGLIGAVAARRVLASFVFGVSTADPWVYAGAIGLMAMVAIMACYFPARRAGRVDPIEALRSEH
jgi:putative ABC transport system permease protein